MALGDPIFIGIQHGQFVLQEGSGYTETGVGEPDVGELILITPASTPRNLWPQRGSRDGSYNHMFAQTISDRLLAGLLREITVSYRGYLKGANGKPHKLVPNCDTQLFQLPAIDEALRVRWVAPVPQPTLLRQYVTFTQPTLDGVGGSASAPWLPAVPSFSLVFTPDPDEPVTRNYYTGWRLVSRTWPEEAIGAWPVTEFYAYFNALA